MWSSLASPARLPGSRSMVQRVSATAAMDDDEKCETENRVTPVCCGIRFDSQAARASSLSGASCCVRLYDRMWSTARLA